MSLDIEHDAHADSWSTPEPHHMIPPADAGCIATRAIEQHPSRQKQRRVAIGSRTGLVAYVWSLGRRKEVAPDDSTRFRFLMSRCPALRLLLNFRATGVQVLLHFRVQPVYGVEKPLDTPRMHQPLISKKASVTGRHVSPVPFSHGISLYCSAYLASISWAYERLPRKFVIATFTASGSSTVEV